MSRRWNLMTATPAAAAAILLGGWAVSAGKPTTSGSQVTICGLGTVGNQNNPSGSSDQDHPNGAMFMGDEQAFGTKCTGNNSGGSSDGWSILHSNVNTDEAAERGTEHGEFARGGTSQEAGFDGHITDYDLGPSQTAPFCTDGSRTIYYQSGHESQCADPSVGNFNTHGGASTNQHFRGKYGTLVFQDSSTNSMCPNDTSAGATYCIQIDLDGQTN